jgi:hypothetical protein
MTTAATSLLGLALPVTGELSGTWGDTVNNAITSLLDTAVAGTTTLSTDADVTLTTTTLAANQARQAILLWNASGTVTRTITAPAQSKVYVVHNKTGSTQSIKLVGVGPTTGVTIVANESAVCAWNGSDFVKIASTAAVSSFSAGTTGLTPSTSTTGAITLAGTLGTANGGTNLTTFTSGGAVYAASTSALTTGTLPVASGGTGATTLTGLVKGSGTSAFTAATAGTDYVAPGTATTFTALQTFAGTASNADMKTSNILETATISATAATGTINFDATVSPVLHHKCVWQLYCQL